MLTHRGNTRRAARLLTVGAGIAALAGLLLAGGSGTYATVAIRERSRKR